MKDMPKGCTYVADLTVPLAVQLVLTNSNRLKILGDDLAREMGATVKSKAFQSYAEEGLALCVFFEEGHLVLETIPSKLVLSVTITTRTETVDANADGHGGIPPGSSFRDSDVAASPDTLPSPGLGHGHVAV